MEARFIFAGIYGLLGGFCSVTALQMAAAIRRAAFWPSAEGTVTESFLRINPFQGWSWQPSVAYEFVVSTNIHGTAVDLKFYGHRPRLSGPWFWGFNGPRQEVSRFSAGSKVKVYYDPRHPNNNCLDRDDNSGVYVLSFIALVSFAVALIELYFGRTG
jgi:hypothetical protein